MTTDGGAAGRVDGRARSGDDGTRRTADGTQPGDDRTRPGDDRTQPGDDRTQPGDDRTQHDDQTAQGGPAPAGATGERRVDRTTARSQQTVRDQPPNVVLLVMDTARARDVLDRRDVTPNLHRLADDGATFSNVYTTAPWTLPSHASLFTGQYTSRHGTHAAAREFDPEAPTLAEQLRDRGYQTVAFSNNSWISRDFGFDAGFEEFNAAWELFDDAADLVSVAKEHDGRIEQLLALAREVSWRRVPPTVANLLYATLLRRRYDDGALVTNWRIGRWFERRRDENRPYFLFVNYLEPHLEYRPPRGYRTEFLPDGVDYAEASAVNQDAWSYLAGATSMDERDFEILHGLYRGELRYLDERIGRLVDLLRERGELSNTLFVVAGDHGENLGDHGLMDHQYCLYDTLTHVPVICRGPQDVAFPGHCDGLRELRDLYPTILEVAGVEPPTDVGASGRSLLDPRGRDYVLGEYLAPQPDVDALRERANGEVDADLERFDRGLRCVRTHDWKLVEDTNGDEELYSFPEPGEEVRATDAPDGLRDRLRSTLYDELGPLERPSVESDGVEVDGDTRTRLEDLGYIYGND